MPSAPWYGDEASWVVCESVSPARAPMYATSPAAILFFACGIVPHGCAKLPSFTSAPVELTKKMLPARTVKGTPFESPLAACTTMSPVLEEGPSWIVILVLVQIG